MESRCDKEAWEVTVPGMVPAGESSCEHCAGCEQKARLMNSRVRITDKSNPIRAKNNESDFP
jgi:hypothetical protein